VLLSGKRRSRPHRGQHRVTFHLPTSGGQRRLSGCEGEGDTTIFLLAGAVAAVLSDKALRAAWADGPRRRREGLEALPDFTALPRDEEGRPIIPQSRVTALVEARDAWASELGILDAVTHSRAAGHAPNIGAIAAEGAAQPSVVGERRGREARSRPGHCKVAGVWSAGVRRVG
jgi:hypothetical protein